MQYYIWDKRDEDESLAWIHSLSDAIDQNPLSFQLGKAVSIKDWLP